MTVSVLAQMANDMLERLERRQWAERTEKQRLYQQAFEQDLALYRSTGLIASMQPHTLLGFIGHKV